MKAEAKISSATKKLLPLLAAVLLLGVTLDKLGYNILSGQMTLIVSLFALVLLITESSDPPKGLSGKKAKWFAMAVLAIGVLLALAIVPPMFGVVLPIIGDMTVLITAAGMILALLLMVI